MVGQGCTIGIGTMIRNSYIFDNTHIGSNCVIERSIIGSNVRIKDNSNVPRGCLIADSVLIGPSAKLEPFDRLSACLDGLDGDLDDEEHDSDLEDVETSCVFHPSSFIYSDIFILGQSSIDKPPLGIDSNALVWPREPLGEEEDEESPENEQNLRSMRIGESRNLRQLLLTRLFLFFSRQRVRRRALRLGLSIREFERACGKRQRIRRAGTWITHCTF